MPSPKVDPALVSVIVEQVLAALQTMKLTNDGYDASASDVESSDGEIVHFSLPAAPAAKVPIAAVPAVAVPALTTTATDAAPATTAAPAPVHVTGESWYMISAGCRVGVYRGWHLVRPLVLGVSGACYKKYPSEATALAAFAEAEAAEVVTVVP
ncbi:hypothetical protein JOM56_001068 [Amanita muscaria]